ncbi:DUF488 domain-containing protein [Barrientosiimonas marina]|uniref:DUF488 domain-containing protein n=1 Tax=Lentibacillus kimchii TaxID=1542911 RepID=A0ABW2UZV5_9BACI
MAVRLKRIYDQAEQDDGLRVLVDRVWPRGVAKDKAQLDHWLKSIGPSKELRQWFGHDPEKYMTFKERYENELKEGSQHEAWEQLKDLADGTKQLTLLFASKDEEHNQARVLKELLDKS